MKRVFFLLCMMLMTLWGYESISNEQLAVLSQKGAIVDIRTPAEWRETGVIAGSHLITFFQDDGSYDAREFLQKLSQAKLDKKPLIIICRSGNRSVLVSGFLTQQGFKEVYNVQHGIVGWIASGRGVAKIK